MRDEITLRDYFESRLNSVALQIEDIEKAARIALESLDKRLDGMNEFRDTLRDQAGRFIVRTEFDLVVHRLEQDIKNLEDAKAQLLNIDTYDTAHKDLQKQVDELRINRALMEGKASQNSLMITLAISFVGLALALVNTISRFTGH